MSAEIFKDVQLSANTAEMRLTQHDKDKLQEIYDLKLHGMFPEQRHRMPKLDHILDGDLDVREPYDKDPNASVDKGATYWGMLHYRGAIMRNLNGNVPIHEWHIQEVIAMFCSGIDKDYSFSRLYYSETRTRLMFALYKRIALRVKHVKGGGAGDNIALLVGYTLACMEYIVGGEALGAFYDSSKPTQHMRRFAELYMKYSKDFPTFNDNQSRHMRKDVANWILKRTYKPEWQLIINDDIKANLDFMFPGGFDQIESMAYKKHRNRCSRRPTLKAADGQSKYPMPLLTDDAPTTEAKRATGLGFSLPRVPEVTYDPTRIQHLAGKDAFVKALIEPMPHVHTKVKLKVTDALTDFRAIKASLGLDNDKENQAEGPEWVQAWKLFLEDFTVPGMIQLRDKQEHKANEREVKEREAKDREVMKRQDVVIKAEELTPAEFDAQLDFWQAELVEADRKAKELRAAGLLPPEDEQMEDKVAEDEEMEDDVVEDEDGYGSEGSDDMDVSE